MEAWTSMGARGAKLLELHQLKEGRVVADGPKTELLTSDRLSGLFDTPLELVTRNGFYHAVPAPPQ